ncbi:aldose 1-epimerase [Conexibacter woesei]|uniref:Aldose 1-epimerase n=1 Tax=Conexibacter woesei (strain DSM 14684 / CCUG 47730 / CIP 108061 / JCM 11494 / NBRC 100937 / ID131577) TaxID=469383 RepID=D3F1M1_CONWI|nr:aldose 1-epimerase [Conexibacter woesei]ADB54052.1 Aldose 1-epimerase [Conexibacter woesei DSM 14684]
MIETTEFEGFAAVTLRSPDGLAATFAPAAGMVCVSLRDGEEELLGQRKGLAAYAHDGKTMGVPLLHPWANRLAGDGYAVDGVRVELAPGQPGLRRDPNGLPIHGLLAGSPHWRTLPASAAAPGDAPTAPGASGDAPTDTLSAELDFGAHPELLAGFPFPHTIRLDVTLRGRTLTIATTVAATGERPVPLSYGFHPYLRLPGVPRAQWRVELPALRHLRLDARSIPTGAGEPVAATAYALAERALDDGFTGVEPGALFAVSGGGRRVEVRFERGYPAAQVFAPLAEDVVCFEPMTAPTNALVSHDGLRSVAPGARDTAVFSIGVTEER